MSSADYWTNEPPIQIGEIELSPGATVCVGTEVTLALTDVMDEDTLHYCIEDNKEKTRLEADTPLTNYWTVTKDGEVYDGIQDKALAPSEPLKFTPKQPGEYAIEVYADDHPQEPKRNDDRTSTITAAITVLKVEFIRQDNSEFPTTGNDACHMVSKFTTRVNLPDTATFDGPEVVDTGNGYGKGEVDPDNFRVQVKGLPDGETPKIRLEIIRSGSTQYSHEFNMVHGTVGGVSSYRTDEHIRLVSNDVDDGHLSHQTPKVKLLDTVRATLVLNSSDICSTELSVARPSSESGINAKRLAMCKFRKVNHSDVLTNADPNRTVVRMQEAWAQAAVTFGLTTSTVDPVENIIRIQDDAIGQGDVTLEIDSTSIPQFTVGTVGRREPIQIAEDIATEINMRLGAGTAFAYNHRPLYDQALVVVNKGNNATILVSENVPGTMIYKADVDLTDDIANTFDRESLMANYGDGDPDTIDIFIVKYLPGTTGLGDRGLAYPPANTGAAGESRNTVFLSLRAADTDPNHPFSAPHEAGHVLLDDESHHSSQYNLMWTPTDESDFIGATKRLTPDQHQRSRIVNDGKILKQ